MCFRVSYIVENDTHILKTQHNETTFFDKQKPAFCFPCFIIISSFRYDSDNK